MTTTLTQTAPPTTDPDNVPEVPCLGKYNVTVSGPLTTLTFTHPRPKAGPLVDGGKMELESVIRARIVFPTEGLAGLRDLIDRIIKEQAITASDGISGRPN